MARRRFRDRFFTPPVARAMTSPGAILLAGAGASVAIVAGAPIALAAAVGAAAWGARVAVAVPRNPTKERIDPFSLSEPWRMFVREAQQAKAGFDDAVRRTEAGPLRERLREIGERIDEGVEESWQIARAGEALADARARIDVAGITRELQEVGAQLGPGRTARQPDRPDARGPRRPARHRPPDGRGDHRHARPPPPARRPPRRGRHPGHRAVGAGAGTSRPRRAVQRRRLAGGRDGVPPPSPRRDRPARPGLAGDPSPATTTGGATTVATGPTATSPTGPVVSDTATGGPGPRAGLLRSSVVVAAGTGLSRLTGLFRIVAIAYALGTSPLADAYNLANNTPNIIYDLILGGVISATLVPLIVDRLEHDDEDAVDAIGTVVSILLVALTIVAVALAPLLIRLYSLDVDADRRAEQIAVAVPLLLLFMPQVLFYGLTALWTALLNARRSFAAPAFAPVLNNVVVICLFVGLARVSADDLTIEGVQDDPLLLLALGLGTTAGIVAMTLVLLPAMRRAGVRLRWRPDWGNPALRTLVRLSGWTLGYVVTNQVLLLVLLTLMNGTEEGAVSAYTYAWLFFQLPYGLFAVSIMTTFMPELSSHASRGDLPAFRMRFAQGLRSMLLVMLPTVAGYLVLATPIVSVLLERGEFGDASVDTTVTVLVWLALALPGYTVFLYVMRGFTAFRDTRTPFLLNLGESALNAVLAVALVGPFGLSGVIASYAIGYSVGAVVALVVLRRRVHGLGGPSTAASVGRDLVAAGTMALVLVTLVRLIELDGTVERVVEVVAGVAIGATVYLAVLALLRSDDLGPLWGAVARRRSPAVASDAGGARPDDDGMP